MDNPLSMHILQCTANLVDNISNLGLSKAFIRLRIHFIVDAAVW